MPKSKNILVLCHGNVNRSPLLEAVLKARGLPVRSAGLVNPGRRAAKKTREFAELQGLSLEAHCSRLVTMEDVRWAQVVLCMDKGNVRRFTEQFPGAVRKVVCLQIADPGFLPRGPKFLEIMHQVVAVGKIT